MAKAGIKMQSAALKVDVLPLGQRGFQLMQKFWLFCTLVTLNEGQGHLD